MKHRRRVSYTAHMTGSGSVEPALSKQKDDAARLECFRCGVCCMKFQVQVDAEEARRISGHLGLPADEFAERFADPRWRGRGLLLRQVDGACVFLDNSHGKPRNCLIQSVKPKACDDWTPGLAKPECREGLGRDWGLQVNNAGQIEGSEEKRLLFHDFLKSRQ